MGIAQNGEPNGWRGVSATGVLRAAACLAVLCSVDLCYAAAIEAKESTTSVVVRAGKADSPNYTLARQFSEALALAGNGAFTLDVRESQGSVQNVIDAPKSSANTVFTAARSVIWQARRGAKPFVKDPGYYDIRSLFPTVHWVVRQDSGVHTLADLAGHSFVPGTKGSISERVTAAVLQVLGIEKKVQLIDIDVAAAPAAVMDNRVSGLAVAGGFPIPMVTQIASATPVSLLGLQPPELKKILAADDSIVAEIIPGATYPGVDGEVTTVAVPAGAYTTTRMSAATAYALTKALWSQLPALAKRNPAWRGVTVGAVPAIGIKLHAGALRYYDEAKIAVPTAMR
jgi:TRAP transporter TAXI family solute receptor